MKYYQNPTTEQVYGYDPENQQILIDEAIAAGWIDVTATYPFPPTDFELIAQCKSNASSLLYATDWTSISDVASSENSPYLTNQADFIAYRNIVRGYAVNPVKNPTFPTVPVAIWSK